MLRTASLYPLCCEFEQRLPSLEDCLRREWTCDDADRMRSWGPETEVDVEACFPERLRWVRALWTPARDAPEAAAPLVLALDPTRHRDEWVALVAGVVYRERALPVAQARGSWIAHCNRLLRLLAAAVPAGMPVHVLCDPGLGRRDLWRQITDLGWHPVLRYPSHITFRPTGGASLPPAAPGCGLPVPPAGPQPPLGPGLAAPRAGPRPRRRPALPLAPRPV